MNASERNVMAQQGSALVIALILLVILTILGVASMSGTFMQERMAGNVNLQTLAFKAASGGVATSPDFANPATWGNDAAGNPRICDRGVPGSEEWISEWTTFQPFQPFQEPNAPAGTTVAFRQRVGCFEPETIPAEWSAFDDVPLQLLVLNQGAVCSGTSCNADGQNFLAVREVEVRVEERQTDNPTCLIQTGCLNVVDIRMPDSNSFRMDGRPYSCPIKTSPTPPPGPSGADEMMRQLREGGDRTGNVSSPI